jgi:predicted enzyme related to lactoylglutathione lyase
VGDADAADGSADKADSSLALLVNIDVDDLEKAVDFYNRAFRLRIGRRFGPDGVELLGASSAIYLLVKRAGTRPAAPVERPRDYGRHWTPVHLDIVVADINSAVAGAVAAGANLEGAIETRRWGRIAHLADPFGHGFCLVEFLGRGYDEIADAIGSETGVSG